MIAKCVVALILITLSLAGSSSAAFCDRHPSHWKCAPPPPPPPPPPDPTYLLNDEFDSVTNPPWIKYWWWGGGETGGRGADTYYGDTLGPEASAHRDYNVTTSGSIVSMAARRENVTNFLGQPRSYTSSILQTNGVQGWQPRGFGFTYGKVEARIKVGTNAGPGTWSGFWLCPDRYESPWCSDGEIDIVETVGSMPNTAHMNVHFTDIHQGSSWQSPVPLGDDFHTYAVEWRSSFIAWTIDGVERFRYTGAGIPSTPHYVIFTHVIASDGGWAGNVGPTTIFPNAMQVDWVRVSP